MTEKTVGILLPLPFDDVFDYKVGDGVSVGDLVRVPFGREEYVGVVWKLGKSSNLDEKKIKPVMAGCGLRLSGELMKFVDFVADYNLAFKGLVLKMVLSVPKAFTHPPKKIKEFALPDPGHKKINLTQEQEVAAVELIRKVNAGFSATLLDGITGSGKTEVYFEAMAKALSPLSGEGGDEGGGKGRQVLVLVPEIALTAQWLSRFEKRFGTKPAVWHSNLTPKQRLDNYLAIMEGRARVVIGARSALFLPYPDLGLIVVDESHDHSFKQEDGANYQGRDMAVMRAKFENIPVILSTATPDLETVCNVEAGKYACVRLSSRYAAALLPEIKVIDLKKDKPVPYPSPAGGEGDKCLAPCGRGSGARQFIGVGGTVRDNENLRVARRELRVASFLSPSLVAAVDSNLKAKEQSVLFLNRRGYAPLTVCHDCGHRMQCPHCSAWLTEHRRNKSLVCHHCGYSRTIPKTCPECGSAEGLSACGPGVERLSEEARARFPEAKIAVISSDITSSLKEVSEIIERMEKGEIDILIGTQIIAKGHHFPDLTLVGIVDADLGLAGSDLRAAERTFQLLSQVSGRAGRGEKKGTVFIQTLYPENNVLKALLQNDREEFLKLERNARQLLKMPPFGRLASVIVSGGDEKTAEKIAADLGRCAPHNKYVETLGPAPAPIHKLRGKYRYRLLLKAERGVRVQDVVKEWLGRVPIPNAVRVETDIDPYSFM